MEKLIADALQIGGGAGVALAVYHYVNSQRIADLKEQIKGLKAALHHEKSENDKEQQFRRDVIERALQRRGSANGSAS